MKTAVNTIKITGWITLVCFLLTIPLAYFQGDCENWGWLWGNSIAIGVFASSLVVFISEYVKYKHLKNEIEIDLYYNLSLLYFKLSSVLSLIEESTKDPYPQLTPSSLQPQSNEINNCNNKIRQDIVQYCLLRNNNVSRKAKHFALDTIPKLTNIVFAIRNLVVAINEDFFNIQIEKKRSGQTNVYADEPPLIPALLPASNGTLKEIKNLIDDNVVESIEEFLLAISQSRSNNFDWKKDKDHLLKALQPVFTYENQNNHVIF